MPANPPPTAREEMRHATREFRNEHGRNIRIEVAAGLRLPRGCTTRVTMVGPDTVDEGFMTDLEVKHLRDALLEAFPK